MQCATGVGESKQVKQQVGVLLWVGVGGVRSGTTKTRDGSAGGSAVTTAAQCAHLRKECAPL